MVGVGEKVNPFSTPFVFVCLFIKYIYIYIYIHTYIYIYKQFKSLNIKM